MKQVLNKFIIDNYHKITEEIDDDGVGDIIANASSDAETLSLLIHAKLHFAAIKLLALGLPKREAIWWAYLCCYDYEANSAALTTQNALSTVSQWVHSPTENLRIQAKVLADHLEQYTASSWACMSVYWSGGSISPKEKQLVEPTEFMCGHAASNAIYLAANAQENTHKAFSQYIKTGLHIAMGGNGKM
jgi:hypothetical protein